MSAELVIRRKSSGMGALGDLGTVWSLFLLLRGQTVSDFYSWWMQYSLSKEEFQTYFQGINALAAGVEVVHKMHDF